jgi:acetoin utilization protein AcuB
MTEPGDAARSRQQSVRDVMRTEFIAVEPGEGLLTATRLMRVARLRHLLVVRKGILVGVLSNRDVLECLLEDLEASPHKSRAEIVGEFPVEGIMRSPPDTVSRDCSLQQAANQMLRLRIGCLPVVEATSEGLRLVGLVTESDLLRAAYVDDSG